MPIKTFAAIAAILCALTAQANSAPKYSSQNVDVAAIAPYPVDGASPSRPDRSVRYERYDAQIVPNVPGCPRRRFCGCATAVKVLHQIGR